MTRFKNLPNDQVVTIEEMVGIFGKNILMVPEGTEWIFTPAKDRDDYNFLCGQEEGVQTNHYPYHPWSKDVNGRKAFIGDPTNRGAEFKNNDSHEITRDQYIKVLKGDLKVVREEPRKMFGNEVAVSYGMVVIGCTFLSQEDLKAIIRVSNIVESSSEEFSLYGSVVKMNGEKIHRGQFEELLKEIS